MAVRLRLVAGHRAALTTTAALSSALLSITMTSIGSVHEAVGLLAAGDPDDPAALLAAVHEGRQLAAQLVADTELRLPLPPLPHGARVAVAGLGTGTYLAHQPRRLRPARHSVALDGLGGRPVPVTVDETVILLHPPLPLAGVSIVMERERQQTDSLVNGSTRCSSPPAPRTQRPPPARGPGRTRPPTAGRSCTAPCACASRRGKPAAAGGAGGSTCWSSCPG